MSFLRFNCAFCLRQEIQRSLCNTGTVSFDAAYLIGGPLRVAIRYQRRIIEPAIKELFIAMKLTVSGF